jgi:hypothetical protein
VRKTQKKEKTMRAHPLDVRVPHLAGVRALRGQMCAPSPHGCAPPADVRALLDMRAPTCRRARPMHAPLLVGVRALYTWVRAPLRRARPTPRRCARPTSTYVRAPPHCRRARPTPLACVPPNSCARPPPRRRACPPSSQACAP